MSKIIIAGAGGAPTENVVKSWLEGKHREEIIGMGSEPTDLMLSQTVRQYQVPYAVHPHYRDSLFKLLETEIPDFIHFQNDLEIRIASRMREDILAKGIKLYMPSKETIENCVDKGMSYKIWQREGIALPKTIYLHDESDLKRAFTELGDENGNIWIRATVGGGGKGALPTNDYTFAKIWIDRFHGWGEFMAAELLTNNTATWLSIWYEGELVVAQSRKRRSWNFGNRTLSGVTGVTGVGETCSDDIITRVSLDAIRAIDKSPHGIFGVDLTYDKKGIPNPTEINISRFFTTVYFFTKAGLNMPEIFKDIVLYKEFPSLKKKINPLPDGLLWIRGMDREPRLIMKSEIEKTIICL